MATTRVFLKMHRGQMPRSRFSDKPFYIVVDNDIVRDAGWGDLAIFEINEGKHNITVTTTNGNPTSNTISVETLEGAIIHLSCFFNMNTRILSLVNEEDKASMEAMRKLSRRNGSWQGAAGIIYFIGVMTLIAGLLTFFIDLSFLWQKNDGYFYIILGSIFIVLGIFAQRKSITAIVIAIVIYALDLIGAVLLLLQGYLLELGYIAVHIAFLIPMIKGAIAINAFNRQEQTYIIKTQDATKKICSNCRMELAEDQKACPKCGAEASNVLGNKQAPFKRASTGLKITLATIGTIIAVAVLIALRYQIIPIEKTDDILNQGMSSTATATASEKTTLINMGKYDGRNYSNSYWGISYTIPKGMFIATENQMKDLYKDVPNPDIITYFTYASSHPLDYKAAYNANFQFGCEKMPQSSPPSINEYIESAKKQMTANMPGFTFSDTTMKTIDKVEFYVIKAKLKTLTQDMYVTTRNGYYVYFINAYVTNADKKILNEIIASVKFE